MFLKGFLCFAGFLRFFKRCSEFYFRRFSKVFVEVF